MLNTIFFILAVYFRRLWFNPIFVTMKSAYQSSSRRDLPFSRFSLSSCHARHADKNGLERKGVHERQANITVTVCTRWHSTGRYY